jgi:hypothetical protein
MVVPRVYKKQIFAASCAKKTHDSTVPDGLVQFKAKNALNRVRPIKIKKNIIFNCVLFEKLSLNIIQ